MLQPNSDRIIVKVDDNTQETDSGIVLPGKGEAHHRGKVMSVGPGKLLISGLRGEMFVKPDDVVYYERHQGTHITVGETDLLVLRDEDIICKVME